MLIYGGINTGDKEQIYNDWYIFDTKTLYWKKIENIQGDNICSRES
jgi:hypothetical protein